MSLNQPVVFGILLGVASGLLRLAKAENSADFLIAAGLTLIECVCVAGLHAFAERYRRIAAAFRASQAQVVALTEAISLAETEVGKERDRHGRLCSDLRNREAQAFDVDSLAVDAEWAEEAAYRGAINASLRALEGGRVDVGFRLLPSHVTEARD